MEFEITSFRHANVILDEPDFQDQFSELLGIVSNISDTDIIAKHQSFTRPHKSISVAINELLKERFVAKRWIPESPIFQEHKYQGDKWRLDFAKDDISVEVGFNHASVIAWNLIKPVIASELNHVRKAIQSKIGVVITATEEMRLHGGFDGAIGTYEKYLDYLDPLRNLLTTPLLIIGLRAPTSFRIEQSKNDKDRFEGSIRML